MATGIYKITNPKGKVYIGKANNIQRRWYEHKSYLKHSTGYKLGNSLKKYGKENHTFEIIEECTGDNILERERYYQELYNSIENGLNHIYTNTKDKPGGISVLCNQCGKEFLKSPSHVAKKNFCSRECKEDSYISKHTVSSCSTCSREFKHFKRSKRKYCCRQCYNKSLIGNTRAAK